MITGRATLRSFDLASSSDGRFVAFIAETPTSFIYRAYDFKFNLIRDSSLAAYSPPLQDTNPLNPAIKGNQGPKIVAVDNAVTDADEWPFCVAFIFNATSTSNLQVRTGLF